MINVFVKIEEIQRGKATVKKCSKKIFVNLFVKAISNIKH